MHEHLFHNTHSLGPMTILDSHVQDFGHFLILFRCSCDRMLREELEFLFFYSDILASFYSHPYTFLDHVYQIQSLFQFFLNDIMRGCLYVILQ